MRDREEVVDADKVIDDFTNLNDTDDSDDQDAGEGVDDEQVDEETINKELVTWAGRLELESIDLREKAKVLTVNMTKNSETIKNTANELKNEFQEWKQSSNASLNGAVTSFSKATSSFLSATKVLSSLKGKDNSSVKKEMEKILDLIQSTNNSMKGLEARVNSNKQSESSNITNLTLNKKLQMIISSLNTLNSDNSESSSKKTSKTLQTLNENINKCLRRVEDIQNLQIDLHKDLKLLGSNHSNLSLEFNRFKAGFLANRRETGNVFAQLTPDNSFNDSMGTFAQRQVSHVSPFVSSQPKVQSQSSHKTRGRKKKCEIKRNREPTMRRTRANHLISEDNFLTDKLPRRVRTKQRKVLSDVTNNSNQQSLEQRLFPNHTQPVLTGEIISLLSDDNEPTLSDL